MVLAYYSVLYASSVSTATLPMLATYLDIHNLSLSHYLMNNNNDIIPPYSPSLTHPPLLAAMDFKGNIVFDTSKSDGQYKKTASNKKLRALYPEFKFTSIEEVSSHTLDG